MSRILALIFALLIAPCTAWAQSNTVTGASPLTGTTLTGNGFDFTANPTLFSPTTTARQFNAPFTYTYQIRTTLASVTGNYIFNGNGNVGGMQATYNTTNDAGEPFVLLFKPGGNAQANCLVRLCTRWTWINDGAWHTVCSPFPVAGASYLFIDGLWRNQQNNGNSYAATNTFWSLGLTNTAMQLRQFRVYGIPLAAADCVRLDSYYKANLVPTSPDILASNLIVDVPLNNCTGTAPNFSCPDGQDGAHPFATDTTPPTCSTTTPSSNPVSGTISLTGTCSDAIGVVSAYWALDGVAITAPITTSPYTTSFDSTKYIDGVHNLTLVGLNVGGTSGTSTPFAMTTSNSISANIYHVDPVGGSDIASCINGTGTQACLTWDYIMNNAGPFRAGDTFAQKEGTTFIADVWDIELCGPGNPDGCGAQGFWPAGGASYTTHITTYGGGTCVNSPGGTQTGCATFTMQSGSANTDGVFLGNASNVTVSNFIWVGTNILGAQPALGDQAIYILSVSGYVVSGVTITNNETLDWKTGLYSQANATMASNTYTDNLFTCTATTTQCDNGMWVRFNNSNHTIQGNVISNMGASPATASGFFLGCCGNGIQISDGGGLASAGLTPMLDQFNVAHDIGANSVSCGGPVGNWTFGAAATMQFNEVYNVQPTAYTAGCDFDGFDMDGGTANSVDQYNYSHNNFGGGYVVYQGADGSFPWQNNQFRYNIGENNSLNLNMGSFFTSNVSNVTAASAAYNNTFYASGTGSSSNGFCMSLTGDMQLLISNNICFNGNNNTLLRALGAYTHYILNGNDYFRSAGSNARWTWNSTNYTTLSAFTSATGYEVNGVTTNPSLSSGGTGGTCYSSGVPAGPQPCPSGYVLNSGSAMIGTGLSLTSQLTTFGLAAPTRDYYGNAVPNGVGTGYNLGADGGNP